MQNGLSSWSIFDNVFSISWTKIKELQPFEIMLKHCSAAAVACSVANPGPADTWE